MLSVEFSRVILIRVIKGDGMESVKGRRSRLLKY